LPTVFLDIFRFLSPLLFCSGESQREYSLGEIQLSPVSQMWRQFKNNSTNRIMREQQEYVVGEFVFDKKYKKIVKINWHWEGEKIYQTLWLSPEQNNPHRSEFAPAERLRKLTTKEEVMLRLRGLL
jgi:hypothetical protein